MTALSQEIRRDWHKAYLQMEAQYRDKDHALRNCQNQVVILLNLLGQLRDNPNAVADRVDRILGRVVDE